MDSAEKSLRERVHFYRALGEMMQGHTKAPEIVLIAELYEMLKQRYPNNRVEVTNDTPEDMDGIVLKVTVS